MEIIDVQGDLLRELKSDFKGVKKGFVQVGERKWFYPDKYRRTAEEFKNFEVRPDDIWIMGYPRSGTTLTENLVWRLSHNLRSDGAGQGLDEKIQFLEMHMVMEDETVKEIVGKFPQEADILQACLNSLNKLKSYKTRRVIKTHLPFELLPPDVVNKGCKVIYICRQPKDVCVSYYNLQKKIPGVEFSADFEKFWKHFRNGHTWFGPYVEHVKQGFERNGSPNFMFSFYEEFSKDNRAYIKKLSDFLEVPLTDTELNELEEYINIDNFRKAREVKLKDMNNVPVNIVRKGKVGGWKEYFTEEMTKEADEWIELIEKRIGIKYPEQNE